MLFALTAYAGYRALDAFRYWGVRWAWPWSAGALALCIATGLALSVTLRHPGEMPLDQAAGFGPGWHCQNMLRGPVCFRDPATSEGTRPARTRSAP